MSRSRQILYLLLRLEMGSITLLYLCQSLRDELGELYNGCRVRPSELADVELPITMRPRGLILLYGSFVKYLGDYSTPTMNPLVRKRNTKLSV